MGTYVLVHGAWHTGRELEPVEALIEAAGHKAVTPTIKGNRAGDAKTVGLAEATQLLRHHHHRRGRRTPRPDPRLVYWNAFVPNSGESVVDMVPSQFAIMFDAIAAERRDGSVVLPPAARDWRSRVHGYPHLDQSEQTQPLGWRRPSSS